MLDLTDKFTIETAAMAFAAKLQGQPEAVAYLAGSLALFLTPALRGALIEFVADLDGILSTRRLH
jgi:hypothetical protein